MLTIFTTPKPFKGHTNIIQRNAIKSWTLLHSDVEIIVFGDEEGAAEVCRELGIRHEPEVRRHEKGLKYLDYIFDRAQEIAHHDVVCYVNCDIILLDSFRRAVEQVTGRHHPFLMVGRRWDTDITEFLDFARPDWQDQLTALAAERGQRRTEYYIDYFVFTRGLYQRLPALVIGRVGWDNFLIWKARSIGAMVVDVSAVVKVVHQNHDYSYHPDGATGVWSDELAKRNYELAGAHHIFTIEHAQYRLEQEGIKWSLRYLAVEFKAFREKVFWSVWFAILGVTRPARHALGLRQKKVLEDRGQD